MAAQINDALNQIIELGKKYPDEIANINTSSELNAWVFNKDPGLAGKLRNAFSSEIEQYEDYGGWLKRNPSSFIDVIKPAVAASRPIALLPQQPLSQPLFADVPIDNIFVQEEATKRANAALQKRLNEIFGRIEESGLGRIRKQFIKPRQEAIAEEAAIGRLRSPLSIITLSKLPEQQLAAESEFIGKLAGERASGEFDMAKLIETILQSERRAKEEASQFGESLRFRREQSEAEIAEQQADRALKKLLGLEEISSREKIEKQRLDKKIRPKIGFDLGFGKSKIGFSDLEI